MKVIFLLFFNDNTMNPLMVNVRLMFLLRVRLFRLCEIDRERHNEQKIKFQQPKHTE